jgi:hypothetical protein
MSEVTTTEPSVETCLRELREMFPGWKYFSITGSIGALRQRYRIKFGPSFYSTVVKDGWGDTLSEAMSQVRKFAKERHDHETG